MRLWNTGSTTPERTSTPRADDRKGTEILNPITLTVLGSAASEGVPCAFCDCPACAGARRHGGRDVRSRTAYAVGSDVRIDFGPDAVWQSVRLASPLTGLRHLFFTHSHEDHFYPDDLFPVWRFLKTPLQVYGSRTVLAKLAGHRSYQNMVLHELCPGDAVDLPESDLHVTALAADHIPGETALLYLLEHGKNRVLIGNDSNLFPEPTLEALRGKMCRHIFLDCTWGDTDQGYGHMGYPNNVRLVEKLRDIGAADGDTRVYPTHFCHEYIRSHEEMARSYEPFIPAYDGMKIEF